MKQPAGLIGVLRSETAPGGDRDEAALDLGGYDEPEAERALLEVVSRPTTNAALRETCGEALGHIWCRRGSVDNEVLRALEEPAREFALRVMKIYCYQLYLIAVSA